MNIKFTECEEQINKFTFTYESTIDNILFKVEGEICPKIICKITEYFVNISDFTINGNFSIDDYYDVIEAEILNAFNNFNM